MRGKRSKETRHKISEGLKKAHALKKAAQARQAEADMVMDSFEEGSGTAPARLSKTSEFQAYVRTVPNPVSREKYGIEGVYERRNEDVKLRSAVDGQVNSE